PMGLADRQDGVPLAVALAVLAGAGLATLARRMGRAAPYAAAVFGCIVAVPALLGSISDKRAAAANEAPRRWSESALGGAAAREQVEQVFAPPADVDENGRRMHAAALVGLGRTALGAGKLDVARELFESAAAVDPEHVAAYVNLGVLSARAGDHAGAAAITER